MPPYIPPEITDAIISGIPLVPYRTFRPSRTHTLAMCALVCRAWLPRSRVELFEDIAIKDDYTYDLLVERVLHSETMSRYLTSVDSLGLGRQEPPAAQPSKAGRLFLVEFAGKLPGLRTLSVRHIDFTHQRPSVTWPLLLSQFRAITTLMLSECQFSSFSDVRRLLTALPLLSTLDIGSLTWPMVSHEVHLQTTLRPRTYWPDLHTLRIFNLSPKCAAVFLRWMTGALHGSPVKVLHCILYCLPSTGPLQEAVDAFVGRVGPSVTKLYICITNTLPLSGFIALERLSCSLYDYQDHWQGVASVLQGVSSNTMQSITFNAVFTQRFEPHPDLNHLRFDQDTLEELDRVLSGEPFGHLQEVNLDVRAGTEEEEELLCAHARRCLPELHKRKILRLYINDEVQHMDVK
ncbi:hypothetical protein L226DRAFT_341174 [Lentinus tigrinus ALCF2SS1-7]|uniref:F-box domain-containing protein n=1 Tax=Lentinus tigrinus ALCF2SS1-6 TaxID=1328759 RepID=A0A5C2RXG8_9APHY|nr:hypothetical protein L227DRAFT_300551 [Lentinus tigrinus ALCF2SS1-6]RPD68533.1 hypothetical protein L226DRAFT_341174 [Lentinus tigrinus ALCF2SS1-7]